MSISIKIRMRRKWDELCGRVICSIAEHSLHSGNINANQPVAWFSAVDILFGGELALEETSVLWGRQIGFVVMQFFFIGAKLWPCSPFCWRAEGGNWIFACAPWLHYWLNILYHCSCCCGYSSNVSLGLHRIRIHFGCEIDFNSFHRIGSNQFVALMLYRWHNQQVCDQKYCLECKSSSISSNIDVLRLFHL